MSTRYETNRPRYLGIVLFAIAPLLVAITAGAIAHALGCQVDEGSEHACMILGLDWGSVFNVLFVSGWFTILTLPLGAVVLVGLTIFLTVRKFRKHLAPS
ncbi:MAG TPA: hypothetical protein VGT81_17410 [Casimicrobiaceae bacterium]|nr:hypothetical protein [Casimicrobiaceae bacterium]